jgi:hypothetical protein
MSEAAGDDASIKQRKHAAIRPTGKRSRRAGIAIAVISVVSLTALIEGSSLGTVACFCLACAAVAVGFTHLQRPAVMLALMAVVQGYLGGAVIRIFTGRSLDGDLMHPLATYAAVCSFCTVSVLAIVYLSERLPQLSTLTNHHVGDSRVRSRIALLTFGVGVAALVATTLWGANFTLLRQGEMTVNHSIGIFAKYMVFMFFPIILYVGHEPGSRVPDAVKYSAWVSVVIAAFAAIFLSTKMPVGNCVVALAVGFLGSGRRVTMPMVVSVGAAALGLFFVFTPLVTEMRFEIRSIPVEQRLPYLEAQMPRFLGDLVSGRPLSEAEQGAAVAMYLDYVGTSPTLQRLGGIQIEDFALGSSARRLGGTADDPFVVGLRQSIPSPLSSGKRAFSFGDLFTWQLNLREWGNIGAPFVNLLGSATLGYGALGGVIASLGAFLAVTSVTCVAWPTMRNMPWGPFIVVALYNSVSEGDLSRYVEILLRDIPEMFIACVLITFLCERRYLRRTWSSIPIERR